jgi:hypothetical protein
MATYVPIAELNSQVVLIKGIMLNGLAKRRLRDPMSHAKMAQFHSVSRFGAVLAV